MKKFTFSLQSVLRVKNIYEKRKKAELAEIQSFLNKLLAQKAGLERKLENSSLQYGAEMLQGMPVPRMAWYINFADFIQAQIKALELSIQEAEERKEAKKAELVAVVKRSDERKAREGAIQGLSGRGFERREKVLGDLISNNNDGSERADKSRRAFWR
jgi:flagellar export protein FliJ